MHEKIFAMLVEQDEITWQSILYDLIKTEQMNPWDVDISLLTKKYIETLKQLKKMDFRLSGKVLLCASMLLRIKSARLVSEDIMELDRLLANPEEVSEEEFYDALERQGAAGAQISPELIPRTPQPRKRKVSIYDLVHALEKALEVKRRRVLGSIPDYKVEVPHGSINIELRIRQLYASVLSFFALGNRKLTFSQLIPSESKADKISTFVPLLHLTNERKIDLQQEIHFGEIEVFLKRAEVERELSPAPAAQSSQ